MQPQRCSNWIIGSTPRDQFSVRYSLYDVNSRNSRGAGGLNAESASAGLDNTDHTIAVSNIATLSSRLVNETRGQFTNSNSESSANGLHRTCRQHFRCRIVRHAFGFSDGKAQQALRGRGQSFVSDRRALDSSRTGLSLQQGHHYISLVRFAAAIHFPRSPIFSAERTTIPGSRRHSIIPLSLRPIRTSASTFRMNGRRIRV